VTIPGGNKKITCGMCSQSWRDAMMTIMMTVMIIRFISEFKINGWPSQSSRILHFSSNYGQWEFQAWNISSSLPGDTLICAKK